MIRVYNTLSKTKDNAVLVCHALSGDAHAAGHYGDRVDRVLAAAD